MNTKTKLDMWHFTQVLCTYCWCFNIDLCVCVKFLLICMWNVHHYHLCCFLCFTLGIWIHSKHKIHTNMHKTTFSSSTFIFITCLSHNKQYYHIYPLCHGPIVRSVFVLATIDIFVSQSVKYKMYNYLQFTVCTSLLQKQTISNRL